MNIKMIIAYAFVGPLPSYAVDTVHQLRLFYDGDVYFIINDYNSEYSHVLTNKYNVKIINYDDVVNNDFNKMVEKLYNKFCIVYNLKGREKLFIHSFERFFLLFNLMIKFNLRDVFFLELDNLVYDDPRNWAIVFKEKDVQIMFDHDKRCSSGVCYIKNTDILNEMLNEFVNFIVNSNEFINEMTALYYFYKNNTQSVGFLPTHWSNEQNNPKETYETYGKYGASIFDSAAMGIYLGGIDPIHSDGKIVKGKKWHGSILDYTQYKFKWEKDGGGRFIPFIQTNTGNWLKINNLHIHSKELLSCLSDQPKD